MSPLKFEEQRTGEDWKIDFVHPNTDGLAIVRLFLEKYEILTDEDKELVRPLIRFLSNPLCLLQK